MAIHCNFNPYLFTCRPTKLIPSSLFLSSFVRFPAIRPNFYVDSTKFKLSALVSDKKDDVEPNDTFRLTYLEGNSWLWEVGGLKILVDPILVGNLDFGIPWLYDAAKKVLKNFQLDDLPVIDCLLITQSLDDHCHLKTLNPLSRKFPNLRVIATPNAKTLLDPLFSNVIYLEPDQDSEIEVSDGFQVKIKATAGPILGPPWKRPENGYIVTSPKGQEDAVQLVKCLSAKFVVPMKNGDLDCKGFLARIVQSQGTIESFKQLLLKELPDVKVLQPTPGEPLDISVTDTAKMC
ncbi:uncharacterized protein LOC129887754 [Solanum dulcamara]|uniref:uncharacterized protein LOC129887754 n=1 Tax=Solanum dulcamara TaxID=45834 RepID=UPI0024867F6E|nr:uncharacterized protein LOC129887754 [Solanum dulcamara]